MRWGAVAAAAVAVVIFAAALRKPKRSGGGRFFTYFGPEWPEETWKDGTLLYPIRTQGVGAAQQVARDLLEDGDAVAELRRREPRAAGKPIVLGAFSAGGWALDPLLARHAGDVEAVMVHDAAFGAGEWAGIKHAIHLARTGALSLLVITTGPHPNARKAIQPLWEAEAPDAEEVPLPDGFPAGEGRAWRAGNAWWFDVPTLTHTEHKTVLAPWLWERFLGR